MNIALIVLDSVRYDVFQRRASELPAMTDFSHDRCYAASHYTLPSHASLFTGKLPSESGVHSDAADYGSIATKTMFDAVDHAAVSVTASPGFLSPEFNFDQLFDDNASFSGDDVVTAKGLDPSAYVGDFSGFLRDGVTSNPFWTAVNGLNSKLNELAKHQPVPRLRDYGANAVFAESLRCAEEPFFLFTNVVDAHGPFEQVRGWTSDVDPSWTSRDVIGWDVCNDETDGYAEYLKNYREVYGAAVEYLDERVARFILRLEQETNDNLITIVTADHGEALGEGGLLGHRDLVTSVAHVPFLVRNPGIDIDAPEVLSHLDVPSLVSHVVDDRPFRLERDVAPVEKVGVFEAPEERGKYWARHVRAAYARDIGYRWDENDAAHRLEVGASSERAEEIEPADVPDRFRVPFSVPMDEVASGDSVEYGNESVLRNLGYLE